MVVSDSLLGRHADNYLFKTYESSMKCVALVELGVTRFLYNKKKTNQREGEEMKLRWKRMLSGMLAAVMLLTMLPATALAAVSETANMEQAQREAILAELQSICR